MELILAFVVLAAGAVIALRSATSPSPGTDAAEEEAVAAVAEADVGLDTEPWSPDALAEHPNGGRGTATDPDATLTAATPPVVTPTGAPATPAAPAPAAATVTVRPETLAITDDRRLDDVLEAATEETPPPSRPALRLLIAIAGLALAFAAALLLVVRGIQALWRGFFG